MVKLHCPHFAKQHCLSCPWIEQDYVEQLERKMTDLKRLISPFLLQNKDLQNTDLQKKTQIQPPVASDLSHFRNKAKMVVSGDRRLNLRLFFA